ncbi:cytochrome P450 [Calocera viscosa TUFC12733]|uniref:Cytochrome P450 n=1 Tax=Calocera viscosa (strain TUFC12733) TaxID=1330018 RepID=A0A167K993_CALVF|nr:cytochrome P450 [Calocera viscosa TUFC12733]
MKIDNNRAYILGMNADCRLGLAVSPSLRDMSVHPAVTDFQLGTAVLVAGFSLLLLPLLLRSSKTNVPVLANDGLFGYRTALRAMTAFPRLMVEGHTKFNGKPFQMASFRSWIVYMSQELHEDFRKARDDTFSFREEVNEVAAIEYTIGRVASHDPWHYGVVRKQMTQNLGKKFPEIYEEIALAFQDELGLAADGEWKPIWASNLSARVVCRASNRLFVGLPLCRNAEFMKISQDYTITVVTSGYMISVFPQFLKPLAARYLSAAPAAQKSFETFIFPIIEKRQRQEVELGKEWDEKKPFDFLQWMIDAATEDQKDPKELNQRLLNMNFAAMHTSAMTYTHALYWLAVRPEFMAPLREDVELAVKEHGWTKDAVNAMYKVDSFLKETLRINPITANSMPRKIIRDVCLSDGTQLRAGTRVAINSWSLHRDPGLYPNPDQFDPFRFSRKVEEGENPVRHAFATASSDFLIWGGGEHVCAGRFFASQELKTMLAYTVMHYDVKMAVEGVRPPDAWYGESCVPDRKASVLFRKRQN